MRFELKSNALDHSAIDAWTFAKRRIAIHFMITLQMLSIGIISGKTSHINTHKKIIDNQIILAPPHINDGQRPCSFRLAFLKLAETFSNSTWYYIVES